MVNKVDRFEVPDLVLQDLPPRPLRARGECHLRTCRAINTHLGYMHHGHISLIPHLPDFTPKSRSVFYAKTHDLTTPST